MTEDSQMLAESQARLCLLTALTGTTTANLTGPQIVALALQKLHDVFPALRAAFGTWSGHDEMHISGSVQPDIMPSLTGQPLDLSSARDYLTLLRQSGCIAVDNVSEDGRITPIAAHLAQAQTAAMLDAPIIIGMKPFGVLSLHAASPHTWNCFERTVIAEAADQLGLLLRNIHAQAQVRQSERALRRSNKRIANILDSMTDGYIALDRDWQVAYINPKAEATMGHPRTEILGQNIWQLYPEAVDHSVHPALHQAMSRQITMTLEARFPCWDRWLELSIYPSQDGLSIYSRDLTGHRQAEEELRQGLEKMQRSLSGVVQAMSFAVEIRDPYTAGHQRRVSALAARIAHKMGLSEEHTEQVRTAGLLHDIGKIAIPAEILSRPGALTQAEISIIQMHAQVGYNILKGIEFAGPVAQVALQHHERINGSGYPEGLKGNDILLESRIMAVADVVEAMASHRPYRPALGLQKAMEEILRNKSTLYDALVVDACFELFRANGFDFEQLLLHDGTGH